MLMFLDTTIESYLDQLASAEPTPGGGSAAALSGAMGAALASMVARLTLGKPKYADVQEEIENVLQDTEQLRESFRLLMLEDIDAYGNLSAALKMPRATPDEVLVRTEAIQRRLAEAALVPLRMAERAADLVRNCERIAEIGNVSVISDVATGAALAASAGAGAAWMVRANVRSMKDLEMVSVLSNRLSVALDEITEGSQRVTNIVGGRT
jgi:formiminotetrahydrofolate cyclodeaminase